MAIEEVHTKVVGSKSYSLNRIRYNSSSFGDFNELKSKTTRRPEIPVLNTSSMDQLNSDLVVTEPPVTHNNLIGVKRLFDSSPKAKTRLKPRLNDYEMNNVVSS